MFIETFLKIASFIDIPGINTDALCNFLLDYYRQKIKRENATIAEVCTILKSDKSLSEKKVKNICDDIKEIEKKNIPIKCVWVFNSIDETLRAKEIIERVEKTFGTNKNSVLPSDYTSESKWSKYDLLQKISRGVYGLSDEGKKIWSKLHETE